MYPVRIKTPALSQMNRLMEDFFEGGFSPFTQPPVNIKQSESGFVIELSAPGFEKENFSIAVENKVLRIKGEHKTEKEESGEKYTRREFGKVAFERSFTLPSDIKEDDITAEYKNGILRLALSRKEVTKSVHSVSVS